MRIHHGQGLALGLEASHHLTGIHADLDELERHAASHVKLLIRHVDHAHAALADLLQEFEGTDERSRAFLDRFDGSRSGRAYRRIVIEERVRGLVGVEQSPDACAARGNTGAGVVEKGLPLFGRFDLQRHVENLDVLLVMVDLGACEVQGAGGGGEAS